MVDPVPDEADVVARSVTTETRLLVTAERLFAERGVGSVSLRAVMQAAGTNVAAVHYHFGSKEALLEAVVRYRMDEVSRSRAELVADVDLDASALANAFVAPLLHLSQNGGHHWVRLVSRLLSSNDVALAPLTKTFAQRNTIFVGLVEKLDPTAGRKAIDFRLAQSMVLVMNVLGDVERVRGFMSGRGEPWTPDEVVEHLVDLVAAMLAGPQGRR